MKITIKIKIKMEVLDLTLPTPAENLACDEALLDWREEEGGEEILRFWEPREHFVVVGYANKVASEVNVAACEGKIPVLRRCSGGGTVLQGPGCLNYSLILKIAENGALRSITSANRFVMERNRAAIEKLLTSQPATGNGQPAIEVQGHTDLTIRYPLSAIRHPLKFSGNAQRRKKKFLLFHGTFLLDFDLALVEKILPLPSKQPHYRQNRSHADFLVNLARPSGSLKRALRQAWRAADPLQNVPWEKIALLARDKYATTRWNLKF